MMRRSLAACLVTAALGCGGQAAAPRNASEPATATAPTTATATTTAATTCIIDDVPAFDLYDNFADCTAGDAALANCRQRCERDDLEACLGLGHVTRARAVLERGCIALRGFPCMVLVKAMDRGDLAPVSAEQRQALIDKACGYSPELCRQ